MMIPVPCSFWGNNHNLTCHLDFSFNLLLWIDNSGHSVNCAIGRITETIKGMIKCWAYLSLSFDINNINDICFITFIF